MAEIKNFVVEKWEKFYGEHKNQVEVFEVVNNFIFQVK
jgi:hypothetical protein